MQCTVPLQRAGAGEGGLQSPIARLRSSGVRLLCLTYEMLLLGSHVPKAMNEQSGS